MRFKNGPQLPGAERTRAGHHHGSHTPTSPGTISLGKMAYHTKQIRRECTLAAMNKDASVLKNLSLIIEDQMFFKRIYVPCAREPSVKPTKT